MRRMFFTAALLLAGCQFTVPAIDTKTNDRNQTLTDQQRAPASEIWLALAHAINAKTVTTTSQLTQYVAVLARNGDLTSDDVSAFDRKFPDMTTKDRPLTSEDASTLRSML